MAGTATRTSFTNARNQRLVAMLVKPPEGVAVVGVLARLHGLGDYSGRYEDGNKWFARRGYAVFMYDAHGHGLSDPRGEEHKFAVSHFSHLVEDAEQFLDEIVRPWHMKNCDNVPLFFGGVSMGALVMMHVVGRRRIAPPDGMVLSAAAAGIVRTPIMRLQEQFSGILNALVPSAKLVSALAPEKILCSKELIEEVYNDKLLNHEAVRVCTAVSMLHGTNTLPDRLPQIHCPVVMLHGDCDETCSPVMAKQALESMQSRDKTWVLISDAKHDLELDLWKDAWFAYVLEWMNRQVDKIEQRRAKDEYALYGQAIGECTENVKFVNEIRV